MSSAIQTGPAFAKTIVLGDHGCGRSSLIDNLDIYKTAKALHQNPLYSLQHPLEDHRQYALPSLPHTHASSFFTAIELTSHELDSGISAGNNGTGSQGNANANANAQQQQSSSNTSSSSSSTSAAAGAAGAGSSSSSSSTPNAGSNNGDGNGTGSVGPGGNNSHSQSAVLKLWEYTQNLSKKDEQLAFRGALFCIIVFDVCNADSFKSVFERWIPLKEQLSSDSFLYVVGTHLDMNNYRQVNLDEICKACAKKDAIYIEVSNTVGTNVALLRKLLCRRVEFMLKQKEAFANRTNIASSMLQGGANSNSTMDEDRYSSEESKFNRSRGMSGLGLEPPMTNAGPTEISIPSLEPHILASSVGSILTSVFGLEEWQGFQKQEQDILKISERIDSFVTQLAQAADHLDVDIGNLPITDDIFKTEVQDKPLEELTDHNNLMSMDHDSAQNLQELATAFKILGLNVPKSLVPKVSSLGNNGTNIGQDGSSQELNSSINQSNPTRSSLRKMLVKLPSGQSAELIIDLEMQLEQQIDSFVTLHGIGVESESKKKLFQVTAKLQKDFFDTSGSRPRPPSATRSVTSNSNLSDTRKH